MANPVIAVSFLNLRNIPRRIGPSLVSVLGIAGVVGVLTATLAINAGFHKALGQSGARDVAFVTRNGADAELSSQLLGTEVDVIEDAAAIVRRNGAVIASPELYVLVDLAGRTSGTPSNVPLRGVGPHAADVREHFRLVAGRQFRPGLFEIIVGRGAAQNFRGVGLGDHLNLAGASWEIVGIFDDGGSVSESELWTDVLVLQAAYRRGTSYQSVRAKVASPEDVAVLATELAREPRLNVSVRSERDYYSEQSRALTTVVNWLGGVIVALMGIGAVFGALNTMYSAVAARTREIATLRAIGFGGMVVLVSVLVEAVVLGIVGGIIGGAVAYLTFDGFTASTLNFQSFSQLSFSFLVTPGVLASGIAYGLLLSLLGGIAPGLRAARMPVTAGLRA